ncbi:galactose oxidase [Neolewinella aurantiaca]|uniref:Galactose oxidase n=2 Tax=Neolewinella aurantiaca TaxID=2602767 RepID=A0A5C7FYA3_9BACT|nr:galactose oxidase [Neolewinella aurantiaca]
MFFLVACGSSEPPAITPPEGPTPQTGWHEIIATDSSAPTARHEAAFIGIDDKYYLLGGRGIKPVDIFDNKTQVWSSGAKPPVEIHHFQPVVWNKEILLLGAMTGGYPGETPLPDIHVYSPATDSWSTGPEIPADRRRGGAGAVIHNNKLYLVCGITDGHRGGHVAWFDEYDLKTGAWRKLPDAPRARDHFQAVVHGSKLYALAGRTTTAATNPFANTIGEVDVYDFKTGAWSTLSDTLPTHRAGNAAIVLNDSILVVGGESKDQLLAHSEVEALSVATGKWHTLDSLSRGRHGTGIIHHDGKLIMASGCGHHGGEPELDDMIVYELE